MIVKTTPFTITYNDVSVTNVTEGDPSSASGGSQALLQRLLQDGVQNGTSMHGMAHLTTYMYMYTSYIIHVVWWHVIVHAAWSEHQRLKPEVLARVQFPGDCHGFFFASIYCC